MNKKVKEQAPKKIEGADPKRIKKILMLVVECGFLALIFSIVTLFIYGFSTTLIITLVLSALTLLFAILELRKIDKQIE
jgi:hypothetical protein